MIQVLDNVWIGSSVDEVNSLEMTAILNVAIDLPRSNKNKALIYAQCGLVDGPGNHLDVYRAAVYMLSALIADRHRVLVCCHEGGRALAICLMYMRRGTKHNWEQLVTLLLEKIDDALPIVHSVHKEAFKELA